MQKLKALLLTLNIPLILLCAYTTRLTIVGANIGDSFALIALTGLYGFTKWLKEQEYQPLEEETKKQLEEMKNAFTILKLNQNIRSVRPEEQKPTRLF